MPDFAPHEDDEGGTPTYKRMQASASEPRPDQRGDQSGAASAGVSRRDTERDDEDDGMLSSATAASVATTEPAATHAGLGGGRRPYRRKYTGRPAPTSPMPAPTHPAPRPRTTPRPQPPRQQAPPPPAAAETKTPKAHVFAEFPAAGGSFQREVAAAAGLGPRVLRDALPAAPGHYQAKKSGKAKSQGSHGGHGASHGLTAAAVVRKLAFDPRSGRVHDEDTGQVFVLQPVR